MTKLEPGVYLAEMCGPAVLGVSRVKETPQVTIPLILETGRKIQWQGYFTKDAAEWTIKALKTLGFKEKTLQKLDGMVLPNQVQVTIEPEEYEGKTRMRVQWINEVGSGGAPISEKDKKDLCKSFDSLLA